MRVKPKAPKRLLDNDIVSPAKSPEKKATVKTPVRVSGRKQTPKMITEPPSKVVKVKKEDKVAKTGDKVAKKSSTRTPRATVVKAMPKKGSVAVKKGIVNYLQEKVQTQTPKKEQEPLECDFCDFVATSTFFLSSHKERKHKENRNFFPCAECKHVSGSAQHLYMHALKSHKRGRYPCNECKAELNSPGHLLQHMKVSHSGVPITVEL